MDDLALSHQQHICILTITRRHTENLNIEKGFAQRLKARKRFHWVKLTADVAQ